MRVPTFPSVAFFVAVADRMNEERETFRKLGFADTTFGIRVLGDPGAPPRTFVLTLDTYSCTNVREVPPRAPPPDGVDFVLEAPDSVWREMLASVGRDGHVDADHTINTLTHHDAPMRVEYRSPEGHDKLFRFSESVQLVFDLAARVEASAG